MALAGGVGVKLASDVDLPQHGWFFGEDQARYLVACAFDQAEDAQAHMAKGGHIGKILLSRQQS